MKHTEDVVRGTVREVDGAATIRMESRYPTDPTDLWSAVTDPQRLARWVAEVEGDLHEGGRLTARFTSGWEGAGRVLECSAPHLLRVEMDGGEGDRTEITATLTPDGDHTVLVIEESGIALREGLAHGAGWQAHVHDLGAHLEGRAAGDWSAQWAELFPGYQERGFEATP